MGRLLAWGRHNWVLLCALCMFVGSDYKFRTRDVTASISGTPDAFVLLELGLYAGLAMYLLLRRAGPPRALRMPLLVVLALAYVLVVLASAPFSPFPLFGVVRSIEMAIGVALALAIALQAGRDELHRLGHGFIVLVTVSVLYGVLLPSPPVSNQQVGRFTWLSLHPNDSAVFVGVGSVLAFIYLTRRDPRPGPLWRPWVYAALLAVQVYGLVASHTRGAVLGAVAAVLVVQWNVLSSLVRRLEYALGIAVAGVLAALVALDTILTYVSRGESVEQLSTLNSRTELWTFALDAAAQKPLYGWGVGASQGIFLDEIGLGGGHNMIINVLVDLGVVGLLAWAALVGATVLRAATLPRAAPGHPGLLVDRAIVMGVLTMILVDGFFIAGPGGVANASSTWLLLCVGWVARIGLLVPRRRRSTGAGPERDRALEFSGGSG
jgi:O-antigen ligase